MTEMKKNVYYQTYYLNLNDKGYVNNISLISKNT